MDTITSPRQAARAIIDKLSRVASDIENALEEVQREIRDLEDKYPACPHVIEIQVDGTLWLVDGFRAVRDVWPCEYEVREVKERPGLETLLEGWETIKTPVTVAGYEQGGYHGELARLSNGALITADWARELTIGRRFTVHHNGGSEAAVFRDPEGRLAAAITLISAPPVSTGAPAAS